MTGKDKAVVRCEAYTLNGTQCSRTSTGKHSSGHAVCTQHAGSKTPTFVRQKELWERLGLPAPSDENSDKTLQRIRRRLKKGPSKGERDEGYIYIYQLKEERHLSYFKVGSTKGSVRKRLKEWQSVHVGCTVELVESFYVKKNVQHVERLIHAWLDYCRMQRYPYMHKGVQYFHSTWYAEPAKVIKDGQECSAKRHALVAKNKHVEWFCTRKSTVTKICTALVNKENK